MPSSSKSRSVEGPTETRCFKAGEVFIASKYNQSFMSCELVCFNPACRSRYAVTEVLYNCPNCGGLLEAEYPSGPLPPVMLRTLWRERRTTNAPLDQSGVWRYREMHSVPRRYGHVVTLREGNTPAARRAQRRGSTAASTALVFKHQGFNPTGSFKDNGMTCGAAQALRLGMKRVACVSTGNTSASMAAYASAAGLQPIIFIPHGNISYGKLAQALEYGAHTLQVEANFDQILALVRALAEKLGIYLLNSINPFRIEGQKTIMVEMMDQRDWNAPDWIVLPGGNLGNISAFGKALREMRAMGFIDRSPGSPSFRPKARRRSTTFPDGAPHRAPHVEHPETLATAIRIGDPVSWPKALHEVTVLRRHGREGHRTGNRRRQGAHRPLRHRLRTRLGGHPRRHPQTRPGRRHRTRRRCRRHSHRQRAQGPGLHLSLSHRPARRAGGGPFNPLSVMHLS